MVLTGEEQEAGKKMQDGKMDEEEGELVMVGKEVDEEIDDRDAVSNELVE
jgi:hypothetical protein